MFLCINVYIFTFNTVYTIIFWEILTWKKNLIIHNTMLVMYNWLLVQMNYIAVICLFSCKDIFNEN